MIEDSMDIFLPINKRPNIWRTNGICKEAYDWLIEVTLDGSQLYF